ncbi:hypothetical protein ACVRWE_09050 [Streptococcus urinalis]|nr:hypothetical protein [Streptococcus urinalis]VEF32504.1 Uncharacterised protein [Streptococcus urinalis]
MMDYVLGFLLIVAIMVIFWKVFMYFTKKRVTPSYNIENQDYNNYLIQFSDTEVPDIKENQNVMKVIKLKYPTENGFMVSSRLSDHKLQDLIISEYDLKQSNVAVSHGQVIA